VFRLSSAAFFLTASRTSVLREMVVVVFIIRGRCNGAGVMGLNGPRSNVWKCITPRL
jgi:hypothetical protein